VNELQSRTKADIVVSGDVRTRSIPSMAIRHAIQIKLYQFPLTEGFGAPATWVKHDGDAVITCPRCGSRSAVAVGQPERGEYRIDARGVLFPSFLCPKTYCDFDHYVQLLSWAGLGKLGRKKDNKNGTIFYAMVWAKERFFPDGSKRFAIMPTEYTHAVDQKTAAASFEPVVQVENTPQFRARMIAVAPAIDSHVIEDDGVKHRFIL
jgi:hypothetical protein